MSLMNALTKRWYFTNRKLAAKYEAKGAVLAAAHGVEAKVPGDWNLQSLADGARRYADVLTLTLDDRSAKRNGFLRHARKLGYVGWVERALRGLSRQELTGAAQKLAAAGDGNGLAEVARQLKLRAR